LVFFVEWPALEAADRLVGQRISELDGRNYQWLGKVAEHLAEKWHLADGSAGSSFAGSTTPTISSALSNLPASSSSSNDFEIGSSQNLRGIGYHHFQEPGPAERCGACVSCERAGCQLQ
jgi:hypothetical protein